MGYVILVLAILFLIFRNFNTVFDFIGAVILFVIFGVVLFFGKYFYDQWQEFQQKADEQDQRDQAQARAELEREQQIQTAQAELQAHLKDAESE